MGELLEQVVDCPRCHQQCGWCSDYRHTHGQLTLPGSKKRFCTIEAMAPEGSDCPLCGGALRVLARTEYTALRSHHMSGEG